MSLKHFFGEKDKSGIRQALTLTAIFFIFMSVFSLHRYYSFYASYDHGLFDQVFWNNLHGHFFQSSLTSANSSSAIFNQGDSNSILHSFRSTLCYRFSTLATYLCLIPLWCNPCCFASCLNYCCGSSFVCSSSSLSAIALGNFYYCWFLWSQCSDWTDLC